MSTQVVGLNLASQSTLTTSKPFLSNALSTLPVPEHRTSTRIYKAHVSQFRSRWASVCFPRMRWGTLGGFFFAFFISCHSLAHFFRCSCHVEDGVEEHGMFPLTSDFLTHGSYNLDLVQTKGCPTSTSLAAVARDTPTYSLRRQKSGLSVSSNLTTPGKVSPCTLA